MVRLRFLAGSLIFVFVDVARAAADKAGSPAAAPSAMDLRWDTAIWSIAVFLFLVIILRAKAWGPVLEGLKKREETIRTSLEEAKKTRDEMVAIQAQFQKELADAHQQIPRLMEEARKKAEEMTNEMRAKGMADVQVERERLRREMDIAKDQALKELWEQAAMLASVLSTKALGRAVTADDHRRLLGDAMQEISQASRN
ncbi:MAG: hypothetical protein EXS16_07125 [Gemmataceae bacterium]|nr:hypothetical protein [Gemmataceae bacterium]